MADQTVRVRLTADVAAYRAAMGDAQRATQGFASGAMTRLDQSSARMRQLGGTLTRRVTLPLALAGAGAIKMSNDFDTSLTKIVGLVGLSRDEVDGMRDSILSLSGETAVAPRQLADAMFFITSAGLRGADAMEALEVAAKGSAAGLGEAATIADAVTSAMNAYGAETLSASRAGDILTAAVREGKMEASDFAPVIGRLLPMASAMGVSFEDVAGAMAVMSRTGASAAESATSIQAIMSTLLKPTNEARQALDEAGLSMADLREVAAGDEGLVGVMRLLDQTFGDNDEALAQIVPNVRAFRGVMNVLAQDGSIVDDVMAGVADSTGVLGEAFEEMAGRAGFQQRQAFNDLAVAAIKFGDALAPLAASVAKVAAATATWLADLPGPARTAMLALLGLAAVSGPLLTLGGNLTRVGAGLGILSRNAATGSVAFTRFGRAMPAVGVAALGVGMAINEIGRRSRESAARVDDLVASMETAGSVFGGVTAHVAGLAGDFDPLLNAIDAAGVTFDEVAAAVEAGGPTWDDMRDRLLDAGVQADGTGLSFTLLKGVLDTLPGEVDRAADKFDKLATASEETVPTLEHVAAAALAIARNALEMAEELDDGVESIGNWGVALDESGAAIDEWEGALGSAMDTAHQSVWKFSDEAKKSLGVFRSEARDNIVFFTEWQQSLRTIAERGGADLAVEWAELGPEFAGAAAEMAAAGEREFDEVAGMMGMYGELAVGNFVGELEALDPETRRVLNKAKQAVKQEEKAAAEAFAEVGAAMVAGAAAGMASQEWQLREAAARAVAIAATAAKTAAKIKSPSRLFADEVGSPIGEGVAEGIEESAPVARQAMRFLSSDLARWSVADSGLPAQLASGHSTSGAPGGPSLDVARLTAALSAAGSTGGQAPVVTVNGYNRSPESIISEAVWKIGNQQGWALTGRADR